MSGLLSAFDPGWVAILYGISWVMGVFYGIRAVFMTKSFLDQYGISQSAQLMARFAGAQVLAFVTITAILPSTGFEGAWPIFAYQLLASLILVGTGLYTQTRSEASRIEGVSRSPEGWVVPIILVIMWAVMMFMMRDTLYA